MIKAYLYKWKITWFQKDGKGGVPPKCDLVIENISEWDLSTLLNGWYFDWNKVKMDSDTLSKIKKTQCKQLIEEKYKLHDQVNTILFGTDEEIQAMKDHIGWILTEYRTNGKDADFSSFTE